MSNQSPPGKISLWYRLEEGGNTRLLAGDKRNLRDIGFGEEIILFESRADRVVTSSGVYVRVEKEEEARRVSVAEYNRHVGHISKFSDCLPVLVVSYALYGESSSLEGRGVDLSWTPLSNTPHRD